MALVLLPVDGSFATSALTVTEGVYLILWIAQRHIEPPGLIPLFRRTGTEANCWNWANRRLEGQQADQSSLSRVHPQSTNSIRGWFNPNEIDHLNPFISSREMVTPIASSFQRFTTPEPMVPYLITIQVARIVHIASLSANQQQQQQQSLDFIPPTRQSCELSKLGAGRGFLKIS